MLESFLAKYGYIAIILGTAFEGETIMIMGGFSAHRGYLKLLPWVVRRVLWEVVIRESSIYAAMTN